MKSKRNGMATQVIHAGQDPDPATGAIMVPIYATSTFVQSSPGVHQGYEYSRSGNPTRTALEKCMAELEEGFAGFAYASGLAASSNILDLLDEGAHIISGNDIYGGTYRLFEQVKKASSGFKVTYVDFRNPDQVKEAIRPDTKAIWIETPTNPLLHVYDLKQIVKLAHTHRILTICDNTFATPCLQKPLTLGFDIVVHSATKYLNGHSDVVAGLVVVKTRYLAEKMKFLQNAVGSVLSPFDAFLVLRGLKTLVLRMRAHSENAMLIAQFLEQHHKVEQVLYPGLKSHRQHMLAKSQMLGFGGMVSFYLRGNLEEAKRFVENTRLFALAESLGGVESLIEHPAIMTHASIPETVRKQLGITDNLIRLSVGIEDAKDLIRDLEQGLCQLDASP